MTDGQTHPIPRDLLGKYFGNDPRLISAFENQALAVMETATAIGGATDATVVTLSPNAAFAGEFVLSNGDGTVIASEPGQVAVDVDSTVARSNGPKVTFQPPGAVVLGLPTRGTLLSDAAPSVLYHPSMVGLVNASSDSAAAAAGVAVGKVYHNGGDLRIRLA
jgi:hypothetical protein